MSEIKVSRLTNRAGTGAPDFSQGVKISGTASTLLAPTRTESATEPTSPANGDTWYDTDNDTYDVYINDEWKRFLGEGGGGSWTVDLSNVTYDSVSFSVASQGAAWFGLAFSNDGTKMYAMTESSGGAVASIFQYSLSTAFDLSTASYDSVSVNISSQDTGPGGLIFNSDGTKMYFAGNSNNSIFEYSLSTGFDLSTASYNSVSFSVNSQEAAPVGVVFNTDGTKMYVTGSGNDRVYQYSLSTGFDLSTASYDSVSLLVSSQDVVPKNTFFNTEGTKMYLVGIYDDRIHQYSLSTGFDLSTASYDSVSFSVSSQASQPNDFFISSTGSKLYIIDNGSNTIYQYSTGL